MNIMTRFSVAALMLFTPILWASGWNLGSVNPETISAFIQGNNAFIYLTTFFGLGLLLAFTPCVLPMVPILSGIIIGQKQISKAKSFKLSLSYVLGMSLTYALAGMLAGYMGSTIQTIMQRPFVIIIFTLIFITMACSMFGFFDIKLPGFWSQKIMGSKQQQGKRNYISVALMGVISTLVVSPCVTAPLIGVLTYIGQNGNVATGGLILFIMSLGMGIPLLLVGLGYGSVLPKSGTWMVKIKQFFGFIMLVMAVWMLSRILDSQWVYFLWASLAISMSIFLLKIQLNSNYKLAAQISGIIILVYSGIVIQHGIDSFKQVTKAPTSTQTLFTKIDTIKEIKQQIEKAHQESKIVMIEFFATWCSDCQAMETKVFNQKEIIQSLSSITSLKVDISQKTNEMEAIRKLYGIYGFPTILFYDTKGNAMKEMTAVGFISKSSFLELITKAKEKAII